MARQSRHNKTAHEYTGIPGSHGIAIGHAYIYDPSNFFIEERTISADEIENEKNPFFGCNRKSYERYKRTQIIK